MRSLGALRSITAAAALIAAAAFGMLLAAQPGKAGGATIYALDGSNLISFNSASPGSTDTTVTITGLQDAEAILAIDFRPANGDLYGLGSSSRLYMIDTATGAAAQVGAGSFATPLAGTFFGFDFNPVVDLIRVVSNTGQNLRLNPDTAAATADLPLIYANGDPHEGMSPSVVALGYTNNFAGASTTTAFGVDSVLDYVVRLGGAGGGAPNPDSGTLFSITSLGVDTTAAAGVDIAGASTAYALLTVGGAPHLYAVNAITGAATDLRSIGALSAILDIAVPIPEATPTPSPSPLPTASPSATPTRTLTPSPTPSSSPTPSPSNTPAPATTPFAFDKGDVDCSGGVSSVDALKNLRHAAELPVIQNTGCPEIGSEFASVFGDMDCDDDVDAVDALRILRFVAGLPTGISAGCSPIGEPF